MRRKNIIFSISIFIAVIFICPTIIADDGQYVISFYAKNKVLGGNVNCTWYSSFKNDIIIRSYNNARDTLTTYNNIEFSYGIDKCDVSNKSQNISIIYLDTDIDLCSYSFVDESKEIPNYLSLSPNLHTIGKKIIHGYDYSNGSSDTRIQITYYLEIRPNKVNCQTSDDRKLLYEEPTCIQATKGFPQDVYKWRYSYKNAQGVPIEGDLYPYRTEDNGATIYVRGSDFLSKTQFNELVETQNGITIIPDRALDYNKPLSVNGVSLTAKPTCPFILKPIEVIQPRCDGYNAEQVKIKLNRRLLKGEKVFLTGHIKSIQILDSLVTEGDDSFILTKNLIQGTGEVDISGRYLDKDKVFRPSYSEGYDHHGEFTITAPDPITINNISQTTTTCIGRADGSVSCEVEGGTGKKICSLYSSDDEFISKGTIQDGKFIFNGLSKGSYYIEAEDENGCLSERSNSIEILEPEPLSIEVTGTTELICFGDSDGIVYFNLSGGTEKKTVYLKYPNGDIKEGDENSNSFSGLSAGTYYLCAKDTNGCTSNTTGVTLEAPEALSLSLKTKNLTKNGGKNGELYATFSGGTKEYVFKIGNTEIYAENSKINELICDTLSAGEKNIILSDTNGCSISEKITLTEPDSLKAVVKQVDSIKCYGDSTASLEIESITGGTPPYYIKWLHSDIALDSKYKIDNLPSSSYLLKVKTDYQDSIFVSIDIDEPKKINLLSSVINTACVGEASGSILLNANGGSAPYKFSLNEQHSSTGEYNKLEAGYYNISVEDENGCKADESVEVKTLSDINLNVTSSSPSCYDINDGTISISINNGVGPYYVRCTEDNFLQVENNLELTNLEAGSYNIEVQDALGCIKTADAILTEPTEFNIELPEKIYLCNDQSEVVNIENERVTNVDWYLNNDLVHTGLNYVLYQEGVYKLDFLYDNLCHSFGKIEIDTINKKVDANFLVAAEIPINDDAHLLNITKAENYDYQEWIYPTNDAWVYGEDENSLQLVFLKEGSWNVGLISYLDKCTASQFKTVKTFIPDSNFEQEENTYLISELSIDKSPNNGKFTAKIELSDKTDIKLYLYNASNGHIIDSKEATGEKSYEIPFSVSTTTGEYILLVVAPTWQKSKWIKMIIK